MVITMNPSITPATAVTEGERSSFATLVGDAARKATGTIVDELSKKGLLDAEKFQRDVLAKGDQIVTTVTAAVRAKVAELVENLVGVLKLISAGRTIAIAATKGVRTLAKAKSSFTWGVDSDFVNYGCDKPGRDTLDQLVEVYEMIRDANFAGIFGSFGVDLNLLCLTQGQIEEFCLIHHDELRKDAYATFFLFKVGDVILPDLSNVFVANVRVDDDGKRGVDVGRFSGSDVWSGEYRPRVVVPQLQRSVS